MNEIQAVIQEALHRYHGIRRARSALAGFGAFVLVMAVAALLDRTYLFSGGARWWGWIAALVVAVWTARRIAGPACPDASALAHRVEAEAGITAPVVATAIDPAVRVSAGDEPVAQALIDRLDREAEQTIRVAPPEFKGRLRGPAVLAVAAVAGLAVLVAWQGKKGLLRMLMPWQPAPYTALVLEGPAELVAEGRSFFLTARVTGVPVESVSLYHPDTPEALVEGTPDAQGRVRLAVEGLEGPATFVARGGDGQSAVLRIEPYPLPNIRAFEIQVTPPTYGAHAAATETAPSFSAFRRSRLRYRLHLAAPATSVVFERKAVPREEERVSEEEKKNLSRGRYGVLVGSEESDTDQPAGPVFRPVPDSPGVWEAEWDLPDPEDIVYRLAIEGEHGDHVRNDEPWRINVLSDAPPKVRIHGHNGAEVIQFGDEKVQFDLSAVDDVGLVEARLVFRKPGQEHTRREIELPPDTRRTWSGKELLDLAPLELSMYDIVAVHVEAQDGNTIDGPGIGRSEVVYLEIPPLEADDSGGDGGGGGGGGGKPPINPLELQMEILRSTIALPYDAPATEQEAIAYDQRQNADYTQQMEQAMEAGGLEELSVALHLAWASMQDAVKLLDAQPADRAIPDEEAALGYLITAAKLLDEAAAAGELPPAEGEAQQSFTLRPPKGASSSAEQEVSESEQKEKELRELMDEIRKQLAEQEKLNESPAQSTQQAESQQALASEARAAASQARGMPATSSMRGDPQAAAEELERAAALQEDNAEALAAGEGEASDQLGAQSAEALAEALKELSAQLDTEGFDSEATPPGYERLINDYLRSISYE